MDTVEIQPSPKFFLAMFLCQFKFCWCQRPNGGLMFPTFYVKWAHWPLTRRFNYWRIWGLLSYAGAKKGKSLTPLAQSYCSPLLYEDLTGVFEYWKSNKLHNAYWVRAFRHVLLFFIYSSSLFDVMICSSLFVCVWLRICVCVCVWP